MKKFKADSGKQIVYGLVTLIIITLGMGLYTIQEMRGLSAITAKMHNHPLTVGNAVRDIRADILAIHHCMTEISLSPKPQQLNKTIQEIARIETKILANFVILEEQFLGDIGDVQQALNYFKKGQTLHSEVIALTVQGKFDQAAFITTGRGAKHLAQVDTTIQSMIDFANKKGAEFFAESKSESKRILITTFVHLFGALITGIMVAIFIIKTWREAERQSKEELWMKIGSNELNVVMRGNQDQESLATHIVTSLAQYLKAHVGALYTCNPETEALHFRGGYGMATNPIQEIVAGQGLTGEVLRSGKKIVTTDIPHDYFTIQSATGATQAQHLVIIPFIRDNEVIGIIELGRLIPFTDMELRFLDFSMPAIATTIIASSSRLQLSTLLAESRLRTKQLERQEQKLTKANNRLGEKSIELSRQRDKIEQRNLDLLTARTELEMHADELSQSSKYKSEFLANMSHELRTPLNSLLILSDSLMQNKERNLTPQQLQSTKVIHNAGQDLLTLINEILDLAKIEAGRTEIIIDPVEIDILVDNIHSMFKPMAKDKGLEFSSSTEEDVPPIIYSDHFRLNQILKNLIGNAIKFTEKGFVRTTIFIPAEDLHIDSTLFPKDNTFAIQVHDSGIGIAPANKHAIFEPFQQVDGSTARQYGGTGLGLSISKTLAHLLGGEIKLQSERGKGAIFTLYLPITPSNTAQHESATPDSKAEQSPPHVVEKANSYTLTPTTPYTTPNILIIEERPRLGQQLINLCQKFGLHTTLSTNEKEGLQLARNRTPDAILLDPKINNQSAIPGILNKWVGTKAIPIHFFEGDAPPAAIQESLITFLKQGKLITDSPQHHLHGVQVLLVDDDMRNVFALSGILEEEGIRVDIAENGKRALAKLAENPDFDVVLMDIIMPEMNGYEAMRKIRRQDKFRDLAIIALTAKAMTQDRQKCFHAGASDFLAKPIDVAELLAKISNIMESKEELVGE